MSNYIVDPMFFYWCDVVGSAFNICVVGFIVMIGALLSFIAINAAENYHYDSVFEIPKFKKRFVIILMFTILFGLGLIFVPTKETLIGMEIAKHATYDNIDIVIDKIIDAAVKIGHC